MRTVRLWLLASCAVFLGACTFDVVSGSGKIVTEPRTVSGFSRVSLSGSGRVFIEQTGTESLTVTTDDNLLPYISTDVKGTTLELGFKDPMTSVRPSNDIIYKLTVKSLEGLDVSGSGRVDAKAVKANQLEVRISGSGGVSAQGTADDLDLRISGSGDYRGDGLKTQRAQARVSGSGNVLVNAEASLQADVSGSGSIEYMGEPQVSSHISGSGSVRRR